MEKSKKKRILVTGGLGFIGSHLVDRLIAQNHEVIIVDNLSSNTVTPKHFSKCEVRVTDIATYHATVPFDEIYHLASVIGPARVLKYPGEIGYRIMHELHAVLNEAIRHHTRFLFTSTSEVYGFSGAVNESMTMRVESSTTIRKAYALGKLLAETEVLSAVLSKQLNAVVVRIFNAVGPRQSEEGGFVLPRFISQARAEKDFTVFGNGSQRRSFIHVSDVVDGLLAVMNSKVNGEVYNVGNRKNTISIKNLAKVVKKESGSRSRIKYIDPKNLFGPLYAQTHGKIPDTTKIARDLKWRPRVGLRQIVRELLKMPVSI